MHVSSSVQARYEAISDRLLPQDLASNRDAWTTTGLNDRTGRSGSHIGDLTEVLVRRHVLDRPAQVQVGVAFHHAEELSRNAPCSRGNDALFGYVQTRFFL